jgi:hypothetical protein
MGKIKRIKHELRQHALIYGVLFCVILVGAFLRVYQFSPWMHFELDQARDVFVVYDALEKGSDALPLLGPQARGRDLYLGPIFYYFGIISGYFFGVTPETVAFPDLLFSILAIPLFYFFARSFFGRWLSVGMTAIVATSLFLVIYGRFAWNPNGMVFWSLVTFYGLLRAWDGEQFFSKWFVISVCGISVLTQLHFIAFIAAPLTMTTYMIMTRMRISWKVVLLSSIIVVFFYLPLVISDVRTGGSNVRAFFSSVTYSEDDGAEMNTAADQEHDVIERSFRALQEMSVFYSHMISSEDHGRYLIRTKKATQGYFPLICDARCQSTLPYHITTMVVLTVSLGVLFYTFFVAYRRRRKERTDYHIKRCDRTLLVVLWLGYGSIFLILVAYQTSPRFFLYLAAPFVIMIGMIMREIAQRRWGIYISSILTILLVMSNMWAVYHYFALLDSAASTSGSLDFRDVSMNRDDIITLAQLRAVGQYIIAQDDQESFVIMGDNRYARALYYIVTVENDNEHALCYMKKGGFDPVHVQGMRYYALVRESSSDHITDAMRAMHTVIDRENIGTLTLYELVPHVPQKLGEKLPEGCFVR